MVVAVAAALGAAAAVPSAAHPEDPDVRIAASTDATAASVDVSAQTFHGEDALMAVVGRNDVFADNLGGSALAGFGSGPLLLTDPGPAPLRPEVLAELQRALGPARGGDCTEEPEVYVLGGAAAVSPAAEQQIAAAGYCTMRLAGPSRVETAIAVAGVVEAGYAGGPRQVLVARDDDFADSAAGGAFAARFYVPVLVNPRDSLHPAVEAYLFGRPDVIPFGDIVLLGGRAALAQGVEDALRARAGSPEQVRRVSGPSRDATAAAIAAEYLSKAAGGVAGTAIVNGFTPRGWVAALTGGAVAPIYDMPVLYVQPDSVPQPTADHVRLQQPYQIVTVGPVDDVAETTRDDARSAADGASADG